MLLENVDQFDYELFKPLLCHKSGEALEVHKITLKCPSPANRAHTTKLRQYFMHAVNEMSQRVQNNNSEASNVDPDAGLDGNAVFMLMLSSTVDMNECFDELKDILKHGCASMSGMEFAEMQFNQLCDDDVGGILGEYIAHFLVPSAMRSAMKT